MKNKIFAVLFLAGISITSVAQDIVFPPLNGFRIMTKYPVYIRENLWDFIDGAAEGYLALGFVDLHVAEYKNGKEVIKLEIYRHSDHTMAFGIYASERSPSFRILNLGAQGYDAGGVINFFKGNYYVKIRTFSKKDKTLRAEEALAVRVADMLAGDTEMPVQLSQFPDEGRKPNEETYINESVLGHQFLNNAFKAEYAVGSDNFSIYLIKLSSPQETYKTAETYLKSAGNETSESDTGKFVFNDGYNGTIFLAWKEDRLVIISGLARDQADLADKYTSQILR